MLLLWFIFLVNRKTEDSVSIHTIYEFGYFYFFVSICIFSVLLFFSVQIIFHRLTIFFFRTLCPRHELVAALCKLLLRFLIVLFCVCCVVLFHSGGFPSIYIYCILYCTHKHTIHLHIILFNAAIIIIIILFFQQSLRISIKNYLI